MSMVKTIPTLMLLSWSLSTNLTMWAVSCRYVFLSLLMIMMKRRMSGYPATISIFTEKCLNQKSDFYRNIHFFNAKYLRCHTTGGPSKYSLCKFPFKQRFRNKTSSFPSCVSNPTPSHPECYQLQMFMNWTETVPHGMHKVVIRKNVSQVYQLSCFQCDYQTKA